MSLRYLTAGESHGKALSGIIEGIPSGLPITHEYIQGHLRRRKLGFGRGARQKIETDQIDILAGVRHGVTLGSPIALQIQNKDWQAWQDIMQVEAPADSVTPVRRQVEVPRPGHADLVGGIKYQHEDLRNVLERASARETAMRVGIASIARKLLEIAGIHIVSHVVSIGSVISSGRLGIREAQMGEGTHAADNSCVRVLDPVAEQEIVEEIKLAQKRGDTLGGVFEIAAYGLPVGLGSYSQWDRRLEGEIAKAFLSLNAIKGVELGLGFKGSTLPGSEVHDGYLIREGNLCYQSNHSGGIDGGVSTGEPIVIRASMKPLSTLMKPLGSVNLRTMQEEQAHVERSDVCAVPAASVIGESLLALVLAQCMIEKFGGDSVNEWSARVNDWRVYSQSRLTKRETVRVQEFGL